MKIKKRLLPMLLSLCLCFGLSALSVRPAYAADLAYEVPGGKLYFDAQTGTITSSDKTVTEADIPAEIYGVPVTAIGEYAFTRRYELNRVTIPDSVTSIGDRAFQECGKLTEIVIPDSVTKVGQSAFDGCSGLTRVTLGRGMTSVPRMMFYGCAALKSITIPDNITYIGYAAFSYSGLTSVTLPDSVTTIDSAAYSSCKSLTSVTLPDSVTKIGDVAFSYCSALKDVRLSNRLSTIPRSAFENCHALESIDIPRSVHTIGNTVFKFCSRLKTITIPRSVTSIGSSTFYGCKAMTDVYYGADVLHWSQVKTGGLNDGLDQATIHFSAPLADFKDVFVSDYYADAVEWAAKNKVTLGAGGNSFAPEATVTRAEAVTFLWRAAGSPEPTTHASPFVDVTDSSAWYYKPVLWATEKKITTGVTTTQFGLKTALAYDQMLTFLCRAAGQDASGSDWSNKAVSWAESAGLTDGLTFAAKDACPRSDVVYFLWKQLA